MCSTCIKTSLFILWLSLKLRNHFAKTMYKKHDFVLNFVKHYYISLIYLLMWFFMHTEFNRTRLRIKTKISCVKSGETKRLVMQLFNIRYRCLDWKVNSYLYMQSIFFITIVSTLRENNFWYYYFVLSCGCFFINCTDINDSTW